METRIAELEGKLEALTAALSQQGGELNALSNALFALLCQTPSGSDAAMTVDHFLEKGLASRLHDSMNQAYLDGYQNQAALLQEALRAGPAGYKDQPDPG